MVAFALIASGLTASVPASTRAEEAPSIAPADTVATILSVDPPAAAPGAVVLLRGTGFIGDAFGATDVLFGSATATGRVSEDGALVEVTVPDVPAGVTTLTVGGSTFTGLEVRPVPIISGLASANGNAGTTLSVTGANLAGATGATIAGVPAVVESTSTNGAVLRIPYGPVPPAGKVRVTVAGVTAVSPGNFTINCAPACLTSVVLAEAFGGSLNGGVLTYGRYLINEDNSRLVNVLTSPTASYSPLLVSAAGDATTRTNIALPARRVLVSATAPEHKLWGAPVDLSNGGAAGPVTITLLPSPEAPNGAPESGPTQPTAVALFTEGSMTAALYPGYLVPLVSGVGISSDALDPGTTVTVAGSTLMLGAPAIATGTFGLALDLTPGAATGFTASTTIGSARLVLSRPLTTLERAQIGLGMLVEGPGLAPGSTVTGIRADGVTLFVSKDAVANATGSTLSFAPYPFRPASLQVHAFQDVLPTNSFPDVPGEGPLAGVVVTLVDEAGGQVTMDMNGDPLCGGSCATDAKGDLTIPNLAPATYAVFAEPPAPAGGEPSWIQTTTIVGGRWLMASLVEGDPGTGPAGGAIAFQDSIPTGYFFGFARPREFAPAGSGVITGRAVNMIAWAPTLAITPGEPIPDPIVTLGDPASLTTLWVGEGNADGTFTVPGVPALTGIYDICLSERDLHWVNTCFPTTLLNGNADTGDLLVTRWFSRVSGTVFEDANRDGIFDPTEQPVDAGFATLRWRDGSTSARVPVDKNGRYDVNPADSGWLGKWLTVSASGSTSIPVGASRFAETGASFIDEYANTAVALPQRGAGNSRSTNVMLQVGHTARIDFGQAPPPILYLEGTIDNTAIANRWKVTLSNPVPRGLATGASIVGPCVPDGAYVTNASTANQNRVVTFTASAPLDMECSEPSPSTFTFAQSGFVSGMVTNDTTRNETDASLSVIEPYSTGIPGALVRLWGLGVDGIAGTGDDPLLRETTSAQWAQPTNCPLRDQFGVVQLDPVNLAPNCVEVPDIGQVVRDGSYDGYYRFSSVCTISSNGRPVQRWNAKGTIYPGNASAGCTQSLPPLVYAVQVLPPAGFQVTREEDVNVQQGLGLQIVAAGGASVAAPQNAGTLGKDVSSGSDVVPMILPGGCVGAPHIVDVLGVGVDGYPGRPGVPASTPTWNPAFAATTAYAEDGGSPAEGDVAPLCDVRLADLGVGQNLEVNFELFPSNAVELPGRINGSVCNPVILLPTTVTAMSNVCEPIPNLPMAVRDPTGRLLLTRATDVNGYWEALVPSTQTASCPIPQGICPGMYQLVANDPVGAPNAPRNRGFSTDPEPNGVWPGKSTQTIVGPLFSLTGAIGAVCALPTGTPELFSVDRVQMPTTGGTRTVTIVGAGFGTKTGTVTLTAGNAVNPSLDANGNASGAATPVTVAITSWSPTQITVTVPSTLAAGPYRLRIRSSAGVVGINGITIHVTGSGYNPPIRTVGPQPTTVQGSVAGSYATIQAALDEAPAGSLILVGPGRYYENTIMTAPVKLQGFGPGGSLARPQASGTGTATTIDASEWEPLLPAWRTRVAALRNLYAELGSERGGFSATDVPGGAAVTVLPQSRSSFTSAFRAQVDGFGMTGATNVGEQGAAGGVYAHAFAHYLQVTDNAFAQNLASGAGAVAIGKVFTGLDTSGWNMRDFNDHVEIANNRVVDNTAALDFGGGGGIGIRTGAGDYVIAGNQVCSNTSIAEGAGIGHAGPSPNGSIRDNLVYYNDNTFGFGGGIAISGDLNRTAAAATTVGSSSGDVIVERNLIAGNTAQLNGAGIDLFAPLTSAITIRNNVIVNNVSAAYGGGVSLGDASNVRLISNTIAGNVAANASGGAPFGAPQPAGVAVVPYSVQMRAHLGGLPLNSRAAPVMFDDILWQNQAYTYDGVGRLIYRGFFDAGVFGGLGSICPSYSVVTPLPLGNPCLNNGSTIVGNTTANPKFVGQFNWGVADLRVAPLVGLANVYLYHSPAFPPGNWHLGNGSSAQNGAAPTYTVGGVTYAMPINDYDGQLRTSPYDIGADER